MRPVFLCRQCQRKVKVEKCWWVSHNETGLLLFLEKTSCMPLYTATGKTPQDCLSFPGYDFGGGVVNMLKPIMSIFLLRAFSVGTWNFQMYLVWPLGKGSISANTQNRVHRGDQSTSDTLAALTKMLKALSIDMNIYQVMYPTCQGYHHITSLRLCIMIKTLATQEARLVWNYDRPTHPPTKRQR